MITGSLDNRLCETSYGEGEYFKIYEVFTNILNLNILATSIYHIYENIQLSFYQLLKVSKG